LKSPRSKKGTENQSQSRGDALWFTKDVLSQALPTAEWLLQGEIEAWLLKSLDVALPAVNQEIDRRLEASAQGQAKDDVLRLLLGVRRTQEGLTK
jgi:hypothetical protein